MLPPSPVAQRGDLTALNLVLSLALHRAALGFQQAAAAVKQECLLELAGRQDNNETGVFFVVARRMDG